MVAIRAYGLTSPGLVRTNNEDAFLCDGDRRLFVVADGMGGHAAGEVASHLAIESIARTFAADRVPAEGRSWPPVDTQADAADRLRDAIATANGEVFEAAARDAAHAGMGTTVVAASLDPGGRRAVIAHVGDSRLYLFADGELTQLTRDDSWVELNWATQGAVATPGLTPPGRNVLTSVLGIRPTVEVHVSERTLPVPGRLLLCSDGLYGCVPHGTIEEILVAEPNVEDAVRALVGAAHQRGAPDNVTALIVAVGADGNEP